MGYRPHETTYRVDYTPDSDFPGLSVVFTVPSLGEWLRLLDDDHVPFHDDEADPPEPAGFVASYEQRLFARCLRGWTVEDRAGRPVGLDVVSLLAQPTPMVRSVMREWGRQCRAMPDPTGGREIDGEPGPIPVTSLPMLPVVPTPAPDLRDQQEEQTGS